MAKENKKSAKASPASGDQPKKATGAGAAPGGGPQALADLDFVKGLIEAVDSSGIDSLEITRAGTRVKISKTPPGGGAAYNTMPAGVAAAAGVGGANAGSPAAVATPAGGASAPSAGGSAEASRAAAAPEAESTLVEVKSPMVGTFYRAPAPEAPPYVEPGTRVTKGQTLCILEAMKLMNELESEVDGVIRQVLVENSEPVEYGQVLFRIDPAG